MNITEGVDLLRQGLVTGLAGLMAQEGAVSPTPPVTFISFNQDTTSLAVGTPCGYKLYSLSSTDVLDAVHESEHEDVYIAERLFSSSLVAVVSNMQPRTLRVCHFRKGTEICHYSYTDKILAVRMNRARLVVCLEESLFIHNIRDMKVLHTISQTPPNPSGLVALSTHTDHCYLAYPGHTSIGELQIFDAMNLCSRVIIPAHEGKLAALQFSHGGTRVATASDKGTVIRVFSSVDGSKLYELRRGLKRTAQINSLCFSPCGTFLACSSNTETLHVFKLDEKPKESPGSIAGSPPNEDGWYGYINTMVSASAGYLPSQVTDTLLQGRAFATVHHNITSTRNTCALAVIRKSLRLLFASNEGVLYIYNLDIEEGGDCSLIKQFILAGEQEDASELPESDQVQEKTDEPEVSYADRLKNRSPNEMTDSEKFHEMASATETPPCPNQCFLLDDDGEFPPVNAAAAIQSC